MAKHASGPTIVLIGGKMTLDEGGLIDSRQALQGDQWDFILRSALTRSEQWWEEARKLVDAILRHDGEGSWALIWPPKVILRPVWGSGPMRIRIASVLPGIRSLSTYRDYWSRSPSGTDTKIEVDACDARYRMFDNPWHVTLMKASRPPSVFVAGHPGHDWRGQDVRTLHPLDVVLHEWPDTALVLPHTPLAEQKADSLVRWFGSGRPKLPWLHHSQLPAEERPEEEEVMAAQESFKHHRPVVLDAHFQITRFIDSGSEADAADLAAACEFVTGRFDLGLGLWDLARDPLLRRTLLKPEDLKEPEDRPIEVPAELADSISEYEWKWAAGERDVWGPYESTGRTALHDNLWPMLEAESWQVGEKGRHYFLPLSPNVKVHAEWEAQPLLSYSIQIHRKQCLLRLIHARQGFSLLMVEPYLRENASALVRATGTGPEGDVVLRLPGHGLDEDMPDWAVGLGLIKRAIAALDPTISGLLEDASKRLRAERDRAAKQREFERTRPERQRHEIARRTALHNRLWPILKMEAWQIEPGREHSGYFLRLGPNVKIHSFVNARPVLFYAIHVHKKHSVLRLLHPLEHLFRGKIEPYLQGNASILTQVIGKEPKDDVVLDLPGHGWDDEGTDWAAGLSLINRAMDALEPSMSRLLEDATQVAQVHLEKSAHLPSSVGTFYGSPGPERRLRDDLTKSDPQQ